MKSKKSSSEKVSGHVECLKRLHSRFFQQDCSIGGNGDGIAESDVSGLRSRYILLQGNEE